MRNAAFTLLSLAALLASGVAMGWQGVLLVLSVLMTVLLLQATRPLRLMRRMQVAPLGQTASCVMLQSRLRAGLSLSQVLELAGALGRKEGEAYTWQDAGGDRLSLRFAARGGRLRDWTLVRAS